MFLTIDLNPYIEKKYNVDNISINKDINIKDSLYSPGTKSIISSVILNMFNEKSFITGFLGGINGKHYHQKLLEINIPHDFTTIKEETRSKIELEDGKNHINIYEESPRINREEILKFFKLYSELVEKSNIIYGSSNELGQSLPEDIYYDLINIAKSKNKRFILNAKSLELKKGIEAVPYMVILDKEQLEYLLNVKLEFQNEIIKGSKYLLDRGVEFVVIDISKDETLILGQDKGYRVESNEDDNLVHISSENGLYAIASGFALGINRKYSMEMTLRLVQALKYVTNLNKDIFKIEISHIKKRMNETEITNINYL